MGRLEDIKAELDSDPLGRGYAAMDDAAAAASLSAVDRPAAGSIEELRTYLLLEVKSEMSLLGRIEVVSQSMVGSDPLVESVPLTLEHITSAKAILRIADPASLLAINYNDSRFDRLLSDLAAGAGCKAIAAADKTAIQALSDNRQSRGNEIGIGKVRESHITEARAI